ncbi:DUF2256 domain-containing protein [Thermomonas sp. XSG]|uniref:DUF2256 domain-containing protein n=1 Tax=Thermomonas sp. XSG TaxID=2771436 RepID=UPI0031F2E97B
MRPPRRRSCCLRRPTGSPARCSGSMVAAARWQANRSPSMPRMRRRHELPRKPCATCGLSFQWRRRWTRDWDAVRYCSRRCRGRR